ncbi:MAG: ATP-binding cassette domain-containing protein [Treponema sp.]|jgi:ABC-type multidrug transport system ATPase subunit|nr:ATP-binding cassette domain-containing protein [Treponema sp.]
MAEIIELKNVYFSAQDRDVVQDISLEFEEGKITAIIGPSGSGKSTVLKISAGLLVPNDGEVFYRGRNIAHMSHSENLEFRRESAFVFQDSALWANQNLDQILELPLKIHYPQMTRSQRMKRIKEVTIEADYRKDLGIRPSRLSMGEQKLIAFARAMLCNPKLLFLDEWVESLDETSANKLIEVVKRKKKEGASVIFVCHDMRIIRDLADSVVVIVDGKEAFEGTKEDLLNSPELSNFLKMEIAV